MLTNSYLSWLLLLFIQITNCYGYIDIGKYLKVCSRNTPETNECLVEAIEHGLAAMVNGIKDLDVPAVDPYIQKKLTVEYNNNQIFAKMVIKDIHVKGLKDAKVHDVRLVADEDRFHLEADLTTPYVHVKGQYAGEGRYNSLQLNAKGRFNTTMSDLVFTWKLDGIPEKINNETYVRITSFYMRPDLADMKTLLTNDNPESAQLINLGVRFANENWRALYRELLPFAQSNWNKIGTRVANKVFLKIPYNQLFPSNM